MKEDSQTPLQEKLEELANKIGKYGIAAAVLTLAVLVLEVKRFSSKNVGNKFTVGDYQLWN